jgi:hypothetical protein
MGIVDEVGAVDILEVWARDFLKDLPAVEVVKHGNDLFVYVTSEDTGSHGAASISSEQIATSKFSAPSHWEVNLFPHGESKGGAFMIDINDPSHLDKAGEKIKAHAGLLAQAIQKRDDVKDYRQHWHST